MSEKKNDALPQAKSNASSSVAGKATILASNIPQNQAAALANSVSVKPPTKNDGGKRKRRKKSFDKIKHHPLHLLSKVHSAALKFYDEQMPYGLDYVCTQVKKADPNYVQIILIVHYRDTNQDDGHFWKIATEKRHVHIILRFVDRNVNRRVKQILDYLGVVYRPVDDDELWNNHGVETVDDFAGYTMYLMHKTKQAIKDGKEPYDITELVSNLTVEEIQQVCEGYLRFTSEPSRVPFSDYAKYDHEAFQLGYDLKPFDKWKQALPLVVRSNSKMKAIESSYEAGVVKRVDEGADMLRICIFIQGDSNLGKTYAAIHALDGQRVLQIKGGGTGKFDRLQPDHNAIVIDDQTCPNLLNMTDNAMCFVYKRTHGNPLWAGQYFIVTSNDSFEEWLDRCKMDTRDKETGEYSEHYNAMVSRFYICTIGTKDDGSHYLSCQHVSDRGTVDDQDKRNNMFMDFQSKFNAIIGNYRPDTSKNHVSTAGILDPDWEMKQLYPYVMDGLYEKKTFEGVVPAAEKWDHDGAGLKILIDDFYNRIFGDPDSDEPAEPVTRDDIIAIDGNDMFQKAEQIKKFLQLEFELGYIGYLNEQGAKSTGTLDPEEMVHYQELASDIFDDYNSRMADELDAFSEFFWTDKDGYAGSDDRPPLPDDEKDSIPALYERYTTFTERTVENALSKYFRRYGKSDLSDLSISVIRAYLAGTMTYYSSEIF